MNDHDKQSKTTETTLNSYEELTSKDYLKAIAYGLAFSFVSGLILGLVPYILDSIFEYFILLPIAIAIFISKYFLQNAHRIITMLICAFVAFVCPLTMFLIMKAGNYTFEDAHAMTGYLIMAPLLGLFLGYKKLGKK